MISTAAPNESAKQTWSGIYTTRARAARAGLFVLVALVPSVLVLLPTLTFVANSFFVVDNGEIVKTFTLSNYATFFRDAEYWNVFINTLWLCFQVALASLILAYPIAWFIWRLPERYRYGLLFLIILPLFMSYVVKLFAIRSILGLDGFLNQFLVFTGFIDRPYMAFLFSRNAIIAAQTIMFLPYMVLPIFLNLERIPPSLIQASSDLGASAGTTFRHIVLPLSLPGVAGGLVFVFIMSLGDYITPQMVGGMTGHTFGRVVWSQFGVTYDWPLGAAFGVVLVLICTTLVAGVGLLSRQRRI
ncbi:ABC transporter permease [Mesorhizobium comanense]|uniref:ABC transporter permease n=1 Tax=Mesorhizobium comanense TaxID=2502215 RepID=UPI00148514FA|nr:ABC transporter permease [Mesorhizobium comanense]